MENNLSVLVVGGGISGLQASLDLANRGLKVFLVEKSPSIGGRMAQLDKTFPTLDCAMCILAPRMNEIRHPNIQLYTYSEVEEVDGSEGRFKVRILKKPVYVDESKCIGCGVCAQHCPIEVPNEFDMNLGKRKAIYLPFPQAVPRVYTIDEDHCIKCKLCQKQCEAEAINFDQKPENIEFEVGAIIVATGFDILDPSIFKQFGYKKYKNVIISLEFERLVCASGPTRGRIVRLSDGRIPKKIAFIQCIGSRNPKMGNPNCSGVCCMYATKEAILVKEHHPETEVYILYMDLRAYGKGFQEFVNRAKKKYDIKYIRSRPGEISEDPKTRNLIIWYEDTLDREIKNLNVDLVVLCPALVPRRDSTKLAKILGVELDEYGYFKAPNPLYAPLNTTVPGIFTCGYCQGPLDIPDSIAQGSGAAAKAAEIVASTQIGGK